LGLGSCFAVDGFYGINLLGYQQWSYLRAVRLLTQYTALCLPVGGCWIRDFCHYQLSKRGVFNQTRLVLLGACMTPWWIRIR
jgi:hypothetical protein